MTTNGMLTPSASAKISASLSSFAGRTRHYSWTARSLFSTIFWTPFRAVLKSALFAASYRQRPVKGKGPKLNHKPNRIILFLILI